VLALWGDLSSGGQETSMNINMKRPMQITVGRWPVIEKGYLARDGNAVIIAIPLVDAARAKILRDHIYEHGLDADKVRPNLRSRPKRGPEEGTTSAEGSTTPSESTEEGDGQSSEVQELRPMDSET
jgi:hypothetical protein